MLSPEKEAQKIINRFGITKPHIPVEEIAKKLGAQVIKQESDDNHSGMIYSDSHGVIIGVNKEHSENRKRFTIAHEIGHMIMHSHLLEGEVHIDKGFGVRLNRDKRSSLGEDLLEIQANKFAAELLMPKAMIKKDIKDLYVDISRDMDEHIKALAKKYKVSQQAMSFKILNTFESDLAISDF